MRLRIGLHGFDPAGRRAVVHGAGGAGSAVILALAEAAERPRCVVVNRSRDQSGVGGPAGGRSGKSVATTPADHAAMLGAADLVVQRDVGGDG